MYISRILFKIKVDQANLFTAAVQPVIKCALTMPGCKTFMLLVSPYDSNEYTLYEEWDTQAQADKFKQSDIRNQAVAKLASAMTVAPEVIEFDAQKID